MSDLSIGMMKLRSVTDKRLSMAFSVVMLAFFFYVGFSGLQVASVWAG